MWAFLFSNVGFLSLNVGAGMKILLPALGFDHVSVLDKGCEEGKRACKTKTGDF